MRGDVPPATTVPPALRPRTGAPVPIPPGTGRNGGRRAGHVPTQRADETLAAGHAEHARAAAPGPPSATGEEFGAIYERHQRRIYRLLRARLGDPEEAADLTQEAFLRAYRAFAAGGRAGDHVGAWLARIAINVACDHHRRGRRLDTVPWDAAHDASAAAPGDDPEAALLDAEDRRAMLLALQALTPQCRQALLLHERDGLSCAAIGALLAVHPATVRTRIFRARRQLQVHHTRGREHACR